MRPLYLIACSAAKLDHAAPAAQIYTGQAFRLAMAAAARAGADVLILSAMHGAVEPTDLLAPYNRALSKMTKRERLTWEITTAGELMQHHGRDIVVLAGKHYAQALAGFPNVSYPLRGQGIGHQLQTLKGLNHAQNHARKIRQHLQPDRPAHRPRPNDCLRYTKPDGKPVEL